MATGTIERKRNAHTVTQASMTVIATMLSLTISTQVWAWGSIGHRIVAEVAAVVSPASSFWSANEKNLGVLTNVPDRNWKSGVSSADERPTHYFEPDGYFNNKADFINFPYKWSDAVTKYGVKELVDHGTAIWRAQQLYALSVSKVIKGDFKGALEIAGAMSHYIGDLSQPLHVTMNYDGGQTNQIGIHKFFETTNLEGRDYNTVKSEVVKRAKALLADPAFKKQNSGSLESIVVNLMLRSYEFKEQVLETDRKGGRSGAGAESQFELAKDQLADGAATLAIILSSAWKNAGSPSTAASVKVDVPAWVAPDYTNLASVSRFRKAQAISFFNPNKYSPESTSNKDCE